MKKFIQACGICFVACWLAATAGAETLSIPGSGNPEYVLGELAKVFNRQQSQHQVRIPPSTGTAGALRDVTEGTASIGRVGRPLKDSERTGDLRYLPVGRDPIAFVAGSAVSVRAVTGAQMMDVYRGKLTNWRDLGGTPGQIRAIGREPTDASAQAIAKHIKEFASLVMPESIKVVHLDPQMIDLLERFPTSLGFLNRSALSAAKKPLVFLTLDAVEPSADNVASGRYPLWLEFGLVYKPAALTEAGRAFLSFLASPPGLAVLHANGVLPSVPVR